MGRRGRKGVRDAVKGGEAEGSPDEVAREGLGDASCVTFLEYLWTEWADPNSEHASEIAPVQPPHSVSKDRCFIA